MSPRPHWLRTPAALPRATHERRDIFFRITDTLVIVTVVAFALAIGKLYVESAADDITRNNAYTVHHAAERCPAPTEHEQVHVIVTQRDGKLEARCLLVGSRQAYHRTPSGMPEGRP